MFSYLIVLAFFASQQVFTAVYTDSINFIRNESDHQKMVLHRFRRQVGRQCRGDQWRCADASCIPLGAKCDGVVDCADASDETHGLCQGLLSTKCVLPPYPEHGSYTFVRPGQSLSAITLTVACEPNYRLDGPAQVDCLNGQWYSAVPKCQRFCNLTTHPSVTYSCKSTDPNILNGERKCNEQEPSGTEVHPRCNDNYYSRNNLIYMHCIDDTWDYVATCQPECGTMTPKGEPLAIGGVSAKRGEMPWHVGIYAKSYTPYRQICGGSLVSTNVVISAAHCFWEDHTHQQASASDYIVGVGKLYRSWTKEEGGQKMDVSEIKLPSRFQGSDANFQADISLLKLANPVVLGYYVRPVCVDFDEHFDEMQLKPGNIGKVAGWGLTSEDGDPSPELKVVEMPYVDVEQCIADVPFSFREYITSDKICAGTKTGKTLCKGDTGGALVFPRVERNVQRWYLRGVVSAAPIDDEHRCNTNTYVAFTQLLSHAAFVKNYLKNNNNEVTPAASTSTAAISVPQDDIDCAEGLDESDALCNRTSTTITNERFKCVLPSYPEHGSYTVLERAGARPGQALHVVTLTVTCEPPYQPDGTAQVHCYNGHWYSAVPECKRFCQLKPHPSVTYFCKPTDPNIFSGNRKCNEFEPSGTEVNPRCNEHYSYKGVLGYMYCYNGFWSKEVICEPECGTLTPQGKPLVINGVSAKRGELPWHAGIYNKRYTPFMQVCGGSLASTTVVISAAHCFWNDVENILPAKYFAVAVGKIYRPWNIEEGGQKSDVRDIKVPPRFLGTENNYQDDIALVILATPVVLGNFVRPVCIDFNKVSDERQLHPGNIGKVAGWGLTSEEGNASQVLKVTELMYVDVKQCILDLPFDFRSYITSDKICAGSETGSALCRGDSGGGLAFPEEEWRVQRWYLRGLVSTAPSNGHKCNANSYTSFTQLLKHEDFVRKYLYNR